MIEYDQLFSAALTILTAIITGGFVLVFVEIGNRKNRECDKYEVEVRPFMRKLSAYIRLISWYSTHIQYPSKLNSYEKNHKELIKSLSHYGHQLIMSGGDFGLNHFSASQLDAICTDVNNIWYWQDKMHPNRLRMRGVLTGSEIIAEKDLRILDSQYSGMALDIDLVAKISGDFYVDIYQPIQYKPGNHEAFVEHYRRQTIFVLFCIVNVLLALAAMVIVALPPFVLQLSVVSVVVLLLSCLLMLGIDDKKQIRIYYRITKKLAKLCKKCHVAVNNH